MVLALLTLSREGWRSLEASHHNMPSNGGRGAGGRGQKQRETQRTDRKKSVYTVCFRCPRAQLSRLPKNRSGSQWSSTTRLTFLPLLNLLGFSNHAYSVLPKSHLICEHQSCTFPRPTALTELIVPHAGKRGTGPECKHFKTRACTYK